MMKRVVSSSRIQGSTNGSRVVQISLDVELAPGADANKLIDEIETQYASSDLYNIVGADVVEDMTDIYEKDYPNLLVFQ